MAGPEKIARGFFAPLVAAVFIERTEVQRWDDATLLPCAHSFIRRDAFTLSANLSDGASPAATLDQGLDAMSVILNDHARNNREDFSHTQAGKFREDFMARKIFAAVHDAVMQEAHETDRIAGYRDVSKAATARRLKAMRKWRGMTQPELAAALRVPDERLKAWEKGAALPPQGNALDISDLFGTTADFLYFGDWRSLRGDKWEAMRPFVAAEPL